MGQAQKGYLPTLDGWRAIAILAVLLDHGVAASLPEKNSTIFACTRTGPNGVSLFFAISGFLICSRLLEEEELTGRISLSGFYVRRACRILPAAFAYLAVIGLLGLAGLLPLSRLEWLSSASFFRNYLSPNLISVGWGGYTVHYWSLAVEEHFYLIWPVLLLLSGRLRARYVAAGMAVAVATWRWWDFHHHWIEGHIPGLLFGSRTDVRLDGLLLGCLVALVLADNEWRSRAKRHLTGRVWWTCALAYSLFQVVLRQHLYTIWESSLLALLVAGTVLQPQTVMGRVLESPVMKWIGRLSYSLYLWQQLFLIEGAQYPISLLQRPPFNVALVFVAAYLSYWWVERPMIRVGHLLAPPPTAGREDLQAEANGRLLAAAKSTVEAA